MSHANAFSCIRPLHSIYSYIFELFWDFSECFSPPPHSLVYISASWHQNISLFLLRTLFVPGHPPLLLILLPHTSGFGMRRPKQTSLITSLDETFIRNAKSFCQTSMTLTFPLSSIVGNGSHYVTS